MKAFIKEYPEFSRLSGTVTRHVALMAELSRLVEKQALLEVSELQQDMAVNQDHGRHLKRITEMINNNKSDKAHLMHLVMLYALRYEAHSDNSTPRLMDLLRQMGCSADDLSVRLCADRRTHHCAHLHCRQSLTWCATVARRTVCPVCSPRPSLSSRRRARRSRAVCRASRTCSRSTGRCSPRYWISTARASSPTPTFPSSPRPQSNRTGSLSLVAVVCDTTYTTLAHLLTGRVM